MPTEKEKTRRKAKQTMEEREKARDGRHQIRKTNAGTIAYGAVGGYNPILGVMARAAAETAVDMWPIHDEEARRAMNQADADWEEDKRRYNPSRPQDDYFDEKGQWKKGVIKNSRKDATPAQNKTREEDNTSKTATGKAGQQSSRKPRPESPASNPPATQNATIKKEQELRDARRGYGKITIPDM